MLDAQGAPVARRQRTESTIIGIADGDSLPTDLRPLTLAVLLSGTGRTLENLLAVTAGGGLAAIVGVVVSSLPGVRGLEIAARAGIPTCVFQRRDFAGDADFSAAIFEAIAGHRPDLILLAGFLRRLVVPPLWRGRILNIHPALLPESGAFGRGVYGERVHSAVLATGAAESGATVHVVDDDYDSGPVVLRANVPILPGDTPATLGARVFAAECQLYPEAIRRYVAAHPELFGRSNDTVSEGADSISPPPHRHRPAVGRGSPPDDERKGNG